jgi:anti-sigma regulatory factor (Ser/Thr protein kinase)
MQVAAPREPGLWHAALFHRGPADFEARASQFVEDAARAGAAVLVTGPASSLDRLRASLDGHSDLVSWADMADVGGNPGRLISAISRFAGDHPGRATWCVHQAVWASRPREEVWEVFRHEALLNVALAGRPVRVLCPYDASLPGELISCAEATHPVISRGGNRPWLPSPGYSADADGSVPAECDGALPPPPAGTRPLPFTDDLSAVRGMVAAKAQASGLLPRRADDLVLAVGELAANTFSHAGGHGTLTMWTAGAEVICQVADGGHITDPLAGRLRPGPTGDRGGRGLWMVHQLCDLVQVRTSPRGTTVRLHMRLAGR